MGDTTASAIVEQGSCVELLSIENGRRVKWTNPLDNPILAIKTQGQGNGVSENNHQEGSFIQAWVVGMMSEYLALRNTLRSQYAPSILLADIPFQELSLVA